MQLPNLPGSAAVRRIVFSLFTGAVGLSLIPMTSKYAAFLTGMSWFPWIAGIILLVFAIYESQNQV